MNIRGFAKKIFFLIEGLSSQSEKLEKLLLNQGEIFRKLSELQKTHGFRDHEFSVFSQNGEDGAISFLTSVVDIPNKTFVEFGVGDFLESNCRFLMASQNWMGFVMDGSERNISRLQTSAWFWKYQLEAKAAFVTAENVDDLIALSGFENEIGVISIDLDGNDYWVLMGMKKSFATLLICEYNPYFGPNKKVSIPYDPNFQRNSESNLYYGASLAAITEAAQSKGYTLIGTSSRGSNAFFLRNSRVPEGLELPSVSDCYVAPMARESRNKLGELTFEKNSSAIQKLTGLPVFNLETASIESFLADWSLQGF